MDDVESRNDKLDPAPHAGGVVNRVEWSGQGRSDAASDHPSPMQSSQEQLGVAAAGPETGVSADVWETINSLVKQKRHAEILVECDKVLKINPNDEKILERKVRTLCQTGKFQRAHHLATEWLRKSPEHPVAKKELKRLKTILAALEDEEDSEDEEMEDGTSASQDSSSLFRKVDNAVTDSAKKPAPRYTVRVLPPQPPTQPVKQNNGEHKYDCHFCDIQFDRQEELDTHCQSDLHKKRLASDESQKWNYRPPPRGQTNEEYILCQRFFDTQRCPYGDKCTSAHSEAELEEWRERYAFRKQQLQQARDKLLHGNTFIEQLLEKLTHPDGPQARLMQTLDFVKIHVNSDLKVNMTTKKCTNAWTFTITSKICLHAVGLLDDTNRSYFHISSISVGPKKTQKYQNLENHCQEWMNQDTASRSQGEYVYRVKVVFKTDIYGTFRQQVVLGFGLDSLVVRDVQVESSPATDPEKLTRDLELSSAGRWSPDTVVVTPFLPLFSSRTETEEQLVNKYVLPRPERLSLSETLMQTLSKDNYRLWMHEMLYVEELAELGFVQRFNVTGALQLVNRFLLMPGALSAAKYTREGELFARLKLEDVLSEDSSAGRLILQNAQTAWVAPASVSVTDPSQKAKVKVYEAQIEEKGKTFVFLRLSADCVSDLKLTCDESFPAQIQFQLNRLPKCEMHSAVDNLTTLNIVFPDVKEVAPLPPPKENILSELEGMRLNEEQREAILTITSPAGIKHPPLLIIGPFGTGKTYTLAQAAKLVMKEEGTRILICTHSNSAADLYIKDFLHPYVEEGNEEARPLRVYYRHRWVHTIPEVILPYSLWSSQLRMFRIPTVDDIHDHRIVITTLSTARYVSDIGLPPGYFTHIFIDEAAQALECETLIPLGLADEKTRIVLAGDHLQISPEVYSDYTRQQGFHISFLERLYDLYPRQCPSMVMLCENYRSHKAIVDFTSELFYDQRLVASGKQLPHSTFYPLSFCHAKGLEEQHENSTGFYNLSEVYEIVDRVDELRKKWPEEWGDIDNNGISVVAPYHDQVIRIRNELRKKKVYNVSVERVLNVQGKQYRVIIISTVRTRNSCRTDGGGEEEYLDYGFLSNVKLLNTAITRAQSLVMVVGDPLSLCLVGKCRKVWEYFLETCHHNKSLFGISWAELRASLDRVEVAKSYVLNPLAPEFVPNRRFHLTFQAQEPAHTSASSSQQSVPWPYYVNQHHPVVQPSPYSMLQHMMPYYGMPMYSPYMGPLLMRAPAGSTVRFGAHRGLHRASLQQAAAAQRAEGVRMVEVGRSLRASQRFPGSRGGGPGGMHMYQVPRMALPYHLPFSPNHHQVPSLYPQPYPYYMMPEEVRMASLHQFPLGAPVTHLPPRGLRGTVPNPHAHLQGPHFHQAPSLHMHPSASNSPASVAANSPAASFLSRVPAGVEDRSEGTSSPEVGGSGLGGSGVSTSVSGQGFQVLPNVKHIPAHLMRPGLQTSSQNSSRSSTPINNSSSSLERASNPAVPLHLQQEGRRTPVSERPYSPANYAVRNSPLLETAGGYRDHSGSREREVAVAGGSTEEDLSNQFVALSISGRAGVEAESVGSLGVGGGSNSRHECRPSKRSLNPKQLRLKTGFSRQFSDDLPTPTAVTDLMRMLDDNVDEVLEEDSDSSASLSSPATATAPSPSGKSLVSRLNNRNAALSSLQLDLAAAHQRQEMMASSGACATSRSTPASDSPAALNGERPTYAGIVGKPSPQTQGGLMPDISQMEPQTPRTPSGFITPGGELEQVDPFGILKGLNIQASSSEK